MALNVFFSFLVLSGVIHLSGSSAVLDVTPQILEPGVTDILNVNCSFSFDTSSNIVSLISLIISKTDNNGHMANSSDFHDIVSVNTFSHGHVTELSHPNASISSHIAGGENSYLSLTWAYPSETEGGNYKCEVNGLDKTGHPLSESVESEVNIKETDLRQVLHEFQILRFKNENLERKLEKLELVLNETITELETFTSCNISDLETSFRILEKYEQETLRETIFKHSDPYKNRTYYISKESYFPIEMAQLSCQVIGGYLVEINDLEELEFVKKYVDEESYSYYAVGISDRDHEGQWLYLNSKEPVPSTVYAGNPPNYPDYHCVCIVHNEIDGCSCRAHYYSICEVPDN